MSTTYCDKIILSKKDCDHLNLLLLEIVFPFCKLTFSLMERQKSGEDKDDRLFKDAPRCVQKIIMVIHWGSSGYTITLIPISTCLLFQTKLGLCTAYSTLCSCTSQLIATCCYLQGITNPEVNQLSPQPPWLYFEISDRIPLNQKKNKKRRLSC